MCKQGYFHRILPQPPKNSSQDFTDALGKPVFKVRFVRVRVNVRVRVRIWVRVRVRVQVRVRVRVWVRVRGAAS